MVIIWLVVSCTTLSNFDKVNGKVFGLANIQHNACAGGLNGSKQVRRRILRTGATADKPTGLATREAGGSARRATAKPKPSRPCRFHLLSSFLNKSNASWLGLRGFPTTCSEYLRFGVDLAKRSFVLCLISSDGLFITKEARTNYDAGLMLTISSYVVTVVLRRAARFGLRASCQPV